LEIQNTVTTLIFPQCFRMRRVRPPYLGYLVLKFKSLYIYRDIREHKSNTNEMAQKNHHAYACNPNIEIEIYVVE
jgi:hypothetical protein